MATLMDTPAATPKDPSPAAPKDSPATAPKESTLAVPEEAPALVLGWKVNKGLDPEYWLRPNPQPGEKSQEPFLVTVPSRSIEHHTVVVAQSGSGKSFFLGRLIEEILTKTLSRVFIIDPNSDFRKISRIEPKIWEKAGYNTADRRGFLPDESDPEKFKQKWDAIRKVVHTLRPAQDPAHKKLQILWLGVSMDLLAAGLPVTDQNQLRHYHEFVKSIANLMVLTKPKELEETKDLVDPNDPIEVADALFKGTGSHGYPGSLHIIENLFSINEELLANIPKNLNRNQLRRAGIFMPFFSILFSKSKVRERIIERIRALHKSAALDRSYVLDEMQRFYSSNARLLKSAGLIGDDETAASTLDDADLQVVDLPSIDDPRLKLLTVSALLGTEWAKARQRWERALESDGKDTRVPTFIVLDEAHNLVPLEPTNDSQRAVLEQFRRIAAEGRKFGLFLVLVSQRPDKLDPLVVSECENRAVMKLGSEAVVKITSDALGLGDVSHRVLSRCVEFDTGRVLLFGPWTGPDNAYLQLYGAARRTAEGGKNLVADHWARVRPPASEAPA